MSLSEFFILFSALVGMEYFSLIAVLLILSRSGKSDKAPPTSANRLKIIAAAMLSSTVLFTGALLYITAPTFWQPKAKDAAVAVIKETKDFSKAEDAEIMAAFTATFGDCLARGFASDNRFPSAELIFGSGASTQRVAFEKAAPELEAECMSAFMRQAGPHLPKGNALPGLPSRLIERWRDPQGKPLEKVDRLMLTVHFIQSKPVDF